MGESEALPPETGSSAWESRGENRKEIANRISGLKLWKGWRGSQHFADKVLYLDMIHTSAGAPMYVE